VTPRTELLSIEETSQQLGVTVAALNKWRFRVPGRKTVPLPFIKVGGRVKYKSSDVEAFIESRRVVPGEEKPSRAARGTRRGSR